MLKRVLGTLGNLVKWFTESIYICPKCGCSMRQGSGTCTRCEYTGNMQVRYGTMIHEDKPQTGVTIGNEVT